MSGTIQSDTSRVETYCLDINNAVESLRVDGILVTDDVQTNAIVNTNNSNCNNSIKAVISALSDNVLTFSSNFNNIALILEETDKSLGDKIL
ncbi:MAG: TIGR04197 family type VII secretion effector [Eubacteriales bacterium]